MSKPIIQLEKITTQFGKKTIHKDLDLAIYPNEVVGIVGGSGSGKTTLLRVILMLQACTHGDVKVMGKSLFHLSATEEKFIRQSWGVMFQHGALFSSLTILENICFPLKEQTNLTHKQIEDIAKFKMSLVGLELDAANKYPNEISGGMKKRVAVARAIALDPKILFLDEPTAGLDPQGASALDELILSLKRDIGLTIIIVTHDLDTLWKVTDRVAFIGNKKILSIAPIENLYQSNEPLIQNYFDNQRATYVAQGYLKEKHTRIEGNKNEE